MPKTQAKRSMTDPSHKERKVFGPKQYIQVGDKSSVSVEVGNGVPNYVDVDNHPASSITKKARHQPRRKARTERAKDTSPSYTFKKGLK